MITDRQAHDGFRHSALIVDTDRDITGTLAAELRHAAATCDEVLLVVSDRTRALLGDGDLPAALRWADTTAFYQRLGFAYEGFRRYLADQAKAGRRVHVVAEPALTDGIDDGLRNTRAFGYLEYEAVCNETYAPYGSAVTCVWDARVHPLAVIDAARATHSHTCTPAGPRPNPGYQPAEQYLGHRRHEPLPPPPPAVDHDLTLADSGRLRGLRATLTGWATAHDFAEEPADDLVVAAVEVASNGLRHAATPVRVRAWRDGGTLIVQCDDAAGTPVPAAAGFRRPDATGAQPGGRGLWLARQLADIVLVDSVPGRTTVRMHFPHAVMHPGLVTR